MRIERISYEGLIAGEDNSIENIVDILSESEIDLNSSFKLINFFGVKGADYYKNGDLENAEKYKIRELRLFEVILNNSKILKEHNLFYTNLFSGFSYSTLGKIYHETNRNDTLPYLLAYTKLSQGFFRGINLRLNDNDNLIGGAKSLGHVAYILIRYKEWNDSIVDELDNFPTLIGNEKAISFYSNLIPNIEKKDLRRTRKILKKDGYI